MFFRERDQALPVKAEQSKPEKEKYVGNTVSQARSLLKLSRKSFGLLFGVSEITIYNWEKENSWPNRLALRTCQKVIEAKFSDETKNQIFKLTKAGEAPAALFLVLQAAYSTEELPCP